MSCRTTPAGSFATTFVQRLYDLEDGQCTALFHQLRRAYDVVAPSQGELQGNTGTNFLQQAQTMATTAENSDLWTPALRARALQRYHRTLIEGVPEDRALRYAFINMVDTARDARRVLQQQQERIARNWVGMSTDDVAAEFKRLYNEHGTFTPDQKTAVSQNVSEAIPHAPQDAATMYAIGVLNRAARCFTCGQFVPGNATDAVPHHCPPLGQRPLAELNVPTPRQWQTVNGAGQIVTLGGNPAVAVQDEDEDEDYDDSWDNDYDDDEEDYNPPAHRAALYSNVTTQSGEWVGELEPWASDAFQREYDDARTRIANGSTAIPAFATPNVGEVTGGLGLRGTGLSFGIELELDFPDDEWPYTSRNEFAQRLYEEGITASPYVERWHFVGDERPGGDFIESAGNWICEFDRSVDPVDGERGVEIKSQILYDEPETWRNIDKICQIAEELGAKATTRTGLHVNVGGSRFPSDDPAAHTALLRLAGAYDDTMIRLAHNPESAASHRGRSYCNYAPVPPTGYRDVSQARAWSNHYQAFNLAHLPAGSQSHQQSSRIEVRLWDSTTDAGRIQAAVATSLALVHLATEKEKPGQPLEPMGAHRREFGRSKLTGEQWESSTASFRRFMSLMEKAGLRSSTHKKALTTMFAESRWHQA